MNPPPDEFSEPASFSNIYNNLNISTIWPEISFTVAKIRPPAESVHPQK